MEYYQDQNVKMKISMITLTNKAEGVLGSITEGHWGCWRDGGEPITRWSCSAWHPALCAR